MRVSFSLFPNSHFGGYASWLDAKTDIDRKDGNIFQCCKLEISGLFLSSIRE